MDKEVGVVVSTGDWEFGEVLSIQLYQPRMGGLKIRLGSLGRLLLG